jgi:uncharacterized membrane protein YhhN
VTLGHILVGVALVVGALDWHAVARGHREPEWILKPLTMVVLIAAAATMYHGHTTLRCAFVTAALVLSLAGDVFLMLPADLFVAGLGSFLLAHLAYIEAFNSPRTHVAVGALAGVAAGVAAVAAPIYLRIRTGVDRRGKPALGIAVTAYVAAISVMAMFAVLTAFRPGWDAGHTALAIGGAVLFFASDGMIGWSRFVEDFPRSRVLIMVTYHLAQAALVLALLG